MAPTRIAACRPMDSALPHRTRPHAGPADESRSAAAERARALELLRRSRRPLLCGHQRPDADVVGSTLALAGGLAELAGGGDGCRPAVMYPDPMPANLGFLARALGLTPASYAESSGAASESEPGLPAHDLIVVADCSELMRLGPMAAAIAGSSAPKLVIDHHLLDGEAWWDAAWRDSGASASGLLVHELLVELFAEHERGPSAAVAEAAFAALASDTGWFRHRSVDGRSLRAAAQLVEWGARPDSVHAAFFGGHPPGRPVATGELLRRVEYAGCGRLALCVHPLSLGLEPGDVDSRAVLAAMGAVRGVRASLYLRELEAGRIKLSVRSAPGYSARAVAGAFGGGGHENAAGATFEGQLDDVLARLRGLALAELQAGTPSADAERRA